MCFFLALSWAIYPSWCSHPPVKYKQKFTYEDEFYGSAQCEILKAWPENLYAFCTYDSGFSQNKIFSYTILNPKKDPNGH